MLQCGVASLNDLLAAVRKHLDVREVTRATAQHLVADVNDAPAALILPAEMSKRYLTQKPSTIELLTDPAQWRELEAIKVIMLLADRETASLGDPFSQELLTVKEQSITGNQPSFSSLEQNIPGFSLMFVLLTLIFSVSLDLQEEEVWGTNRRLSIAPVSPAVLLGGKLLAHRCREGGQLEARRRPSGQQPAQPDAERQQTRPSRHARPADPPRG